MEYTWITPDEGFLKINVHCIQVEEETILGNNNEVGVILHNSQGSVLWATLGPIRGMDEMQATLWAGQAAVIEAWHRGFHAIHLETVNREFFDALNLQEVTFLPPNLNDAIRQFNTMFANNFIENATARKVSIIPQRMNATAKYRALYEL